MSGETAKDESGLTVDTLKLVMDTELRRIDDRFAAFLETYRHDRDEQNQFRGSLDDLGKTMATRRELEDEKMAVTRRFDDVSRQLVTLGSRLDIGPAGLAPLQAYQNQQQGQAQGHQQSQAGFYAMLGAFATVIGVISVLANVLTR